MADIRKFMDQAALEALVGKIKSEDDAHQAAAQAYAEGLGKNYDAAGSAATAKSEAIAAAEEKVNALANGQVKTNKEDIAKLNGDATTEGSVAKAVKDAQDTLQASIDAIDEKAGNNANAIAAINNETTGILAQAKADATEKANAVQAEVDALEELVGELPEDTTAETIVAYIDAKTANIASDETVGAIADRVTQAEKDIVAIEADYLKAADKEEVLGKVTEEAGLRKNADDALELRIKAVEDDYLTSADKTTLEQSIAANANAIELLTNGVSAEEVDGVNDLIQYVKDHGTEVTGMKEDISENAGAIADEIVRAKAKEDEIVAAVATKADEKTLTDAIATLEGVYTGFNTRLEAVEEMLGDGDGSVSDQISDAKQAAIDAAAADASSKADTAEGNAKAHANSLNTAMNARVEALEAVDHEHANKTELDKFVDGDKAKLDEAYAKAHEHANKTELDKIASGDVAKWNAAEGNAKAHADSLNTEMTSKVDAIDGRVTKNTNDIATKADQEEFEALVERVTTAESGVAANTSAISAFTAITPDEINALFA